MNYREIDKKHVIGIKGGVLENMSRNLLQNMKRRGPQKIRIIWSPLTLAKDDEVRTVLFQKNKRLIKKNRKLIRNLIRIKSKKWGFKRITKS